MEPLVIVGVANAGERRLAEYTPVRDWKLGGGEAGKYALMLTRELLPFLRGQFDGMRLTVPTLLLHGTRDLAIDHRSLGRWQTNADAMDVELCPAIPEFLAELHRRGKAIGVVTGNFEEIGWCKLERGGIRHFFDFGSFSDYRENIFVDEDNDLPSGIKLHRFVS